MRPCISLGLAIVTLTLAGCARLEPLGGPYYLRQVTHPSGWESPSAATWYLIYKDSGRKIEITDKAGMSGGRIYLQFSHRVYGRNLAYIAPGQDYRLCLFVYSEKHGRLLVDPDYSKYWKVIAEEAGITCHRYQSGRESDDPAPVVYSADYLAGL
jgi:hypothetical protein